MRINQTPPTHISRGKRHPGNPTYSPNYDRASRPCHDSKTHCPEPQPSALLAAEHTYMKVSKAAVQSLSDEILQELASAAGLKPPAGQKRVGPANIQYRMIVSMYSYVSMNDVSTKKKTSHTTAAVIIIHTINKYLRVRPVPWYSLFSAPR